MRGGGEERRRRRRRGEIRTSIQDRELLSVLAAKRSS